jgi:hypothetical protein
MAVVESGETGALISARIGTQGERSACGDGITGTGITESFTTDTDGSSLDESTTNTCFHADGSATAAGYTITRQCGGSFDNGGKKYEYKNSVLGATGFIQEFKRVRISESDSSLWREM